MVVMKSKCKECWDKGNTPMCCICPEYKKRRKVMPEDKACINCYWLVQCKKERNN